MRILIVINRTADTGRILQFSAPFVNETDQIPTFLKILDLNRCRGIFPLELCALAGTVLGF